jgi:hypothetical protein
LVGEPLPDFSKAFSKVLPFSARAASNELSLGSGAGMVLVLAGAFLDEPDLRDGAGSFKLATFAYLLQLEQ